MNNNNHHYMGIELNMQTFELLDKKDRSKKDNIRIINFAKDSLYHWRKSDKYGIVNEQREKWLISHIYARFKLEIGKKLSAFYGAKALIIIK